VIDCPATIPCMSDRFYTDDPLAPGEYVLAGPEAHHLAAVRRFGPGDRVVLFNGDGHEYPAEVIAVEKRSVALNVLAAVTADRELPFPLWVASALPKGDRADFLIEKLTELGVSRFIPLITTRSVVVPKPGVGEKFTRAVIEASKQCGRNRLTAVEPPRTWAEFVRRDDLPTNRFLLHPDGERFSPPAAGVVVAVGPEGGFTDGEVAAADAAGWKRASLGPRVLRVETAALAAAACLAVQ
jgi:16S rRNA (uracil1498-N3)-methyltransferase